jgi:hypothetical protein
MYAVVRAGRGRMPAYGARMTHIERWAVVNYVNTLQAPAARRRGAAPAATEHSPRRSTRSAGRIAGGHHSAGDSAAAAVVRRTTSVTRKLKYTSCPRAASSRCRRPAPAIPALLILGAVAFGGRADGRRAARMARVSLMNWLYFTTIAQGAVISPSSCRSRRGIWSRPIRRIALAFSRSCRSPTSPSCRSSSSARSTSSRGSSTRSTTARSLAEPAVHGRAHAARTGHPVRRVARVRLHGAAPDMGLMRARAAAAAGDVRLVHPRLARAGGRGAPRTQPPRRARTRHRAAVRARSWACSRGTSSCRSSRTGSAR